MNKECVLCNHFLGKNQNGDWTYYTKVVNYNKINNEYIMVNVCNNCASYPISWKCVSCKEEFTNAKDEFCSSSHSNENINYPPYSSDFSKTCVSCLHAIREEKGSDLDCDCFICSEINDIHTFIPK
jgi:hypothetical protein